MSVLSATVLHEIYDVIEMGGKTPSIKVLDQLQERFIGIPRESLYSIYSQRIRYKYGSAGRKLTDDDYCDKLYETYKKRASESFKNNKRRLAVIPKLAEERGLFPWMTFRAVMTRFLIERAASRASVTKKQIQQVIKNPHLIKDVQLQLEAIHCSAQDQLQGLITDSLRHIVGKDYEQILEKELKQVTLLFLENRFTFFFSERHRVHRRGGPASNGTRCHSRFSSHSSHRRQQQASLLDRLKGSFRRFKKS